VRGGQACAPNGRRTGRSSVWTFVSSQKKTRLRRSPSGRTGSGGRRCGRARIPLEGHNLLSCDLVGDEAGDDSAAERREDGVTLAGPAGHGDHLAVAQILNPEAERAVIDLAIDGPAFGIEEMPNEVAD